MPGKVPTKIFPLIIIALVFVAVLGVATLASNDEANANGMNLKNGGQLVQNKDHIFFIDYLDENSIYKAKPDGSEMVKFSGSQVSQLCIFNDTIIYKDGLDKQFHMISVEGQNSEVLSHIPEAAKITDVADNFVYYSLDGVIYKKAMDAEQPEIIKDIKATDLTVAGQAIYYCNINDTNKIYVLMQDGSSEKISDDSAQTLNVEGDWLYYINQSDNAKLYKVKTDGTEKTQVSAAPVNYYNISRDRLFYISDDNALYSAEAGNDQAAKLADGIYNGLYVYGENVYLYDRNFNLMKISEDGKSVNTIIAKKQLARTDKFPERYTELEGVLTFRGNNFRTAPAYGTVEIKKNKIVKIWANKTSALPLWGGGAGWTGQPALVKWPHQTKQNMNIKDKFKKDDAFVEVIQASLDGHVYFFDLKTGEATRPAINTKNTIKGSVSVNASGYPLLYVGQGIKVNTEVGFHIYSLIDQKELFFQNGNDSDALREWYYFDSSALFNRGSDSMFVGGENGMLYKLDLNTDFKTDKSIMIQPTIHKYKYKKANMGKSAMDSTIGIENSIAAYNNLLFFADNGGYIKCITTDLKEVWSIDNKDDTDASITVEVEDGVPYLYTGSEIDKQGKEGTCRLLKINGLTGKILWEKDYHAYARFGASPSNGGLLATNVVGKNKLSSINIYMLSRSPSFDSGLMLALDKKTGKEVWRIKMPTYAWSSPVDVYDSKGNGYIIQFDHNGSGHIINGSNGKILFTGKFDSYIEASPAVYDDYLVLASRSGMIYGFRLE